MKALLPSTLLLVTIPAAMAFGVALGYATILGIIGLFGRQQKARPTATATVKMPALATAGD